MVPTTDGTNHTSKVIRWRLSDNAVEVHNLAASSPFYCGFIGGFTDGKYGYFVPYQYTRLVRMELSRFGSSDALTAIDLTSVSSTLKGFSGGFTNGRYAYLAPYWNGTAYHGNMVRVDLNNFTTSGVEYVNMATQEFQLAGFSSVAFSGSHGYFVPYAYSKYARIQAFMGGSCP
jgi:hypothetical protein